MTARPRPPESNPGVSTTAQPPAQLVRHVRDALRHLHDRTRLQTHPLASFVGPESEKRTPSRGKTLQDSLLQAIEVLRPGPEIPPDSPAGRTYHLLVQRYVEAQEAGDVQISLAISKTEYYVEHQRALDAVASVLWERWRPAGGNQAELPQANPILGGAKPGADVEATPAVAAKPRHNLPTPLTSFVGRAAEVAAVADLLRSSRLVTLVGVGGCGKTRLALEVAQALVASSPDGVWLVELAPLADPVLLPQAIALAIGIPEQPQHPLADTLMSALRSRRLVLVLDNCEHLIAACARLADDVLRACPSLRVLATSREALGIPGEVAWRVPSLSLPGGSGPTSSTEAVEVLRNSEAARLFVERARMAEPGFTPTRENARAIAEICHRLDGIPLALELAAARMKVLSVEQIAARLDDRFQLLTGGSRTALPRQQTLRATLDWSYHLLTDPERALFRRLSVFAGGFTLQAAEAVGTFPVSPPDPQIQVSEAGPIGSDAVRSESPSPSGETLDLISQLVDKSLVLVEKRQGESRYRMLETVRQYGHERLVEAGEAATARDRHAEWYRALAERAESEGLIGERQIDWLNRLEVEHDNIRAALAWWQDRTPDRGIRLAASMWRFWRMQGFFAEGRAWLERALDRNPEGSAARATALLGAGIIAYEQADFQRSQGMLEESVAWWRRAGAKKSLGHALHDLGLCVANQGKEPEQVKAIWNESLVLLREVGDERGIACSEWFLGILATDVGEYERGRSLIDGAIQIFRRVGDLWNAGQAMTDLGVVLFLKGDNRRARQAWEEQLELARRLGNRLGIGVALLLLARGSLLSHEDPVRAGGLLVESLRVCQEIGSDLASEVLGDLGTLAVRRGEHRRGVLLLAAGEAKRLPIPGGKRLFVESMRAEWAASLLTAKSDLGEETYAAVWAEGQTMTLEQAVAYALEEDSR